MLALPLLAAAAHAATAPEHFTVQFDTDVKGGAPVVVDVVREDAPIGVDHFYELLQNKFFDNSAFFRFVPPNSSGCVHICGGAAANPGLTAGPGH